MTLTSRSGDGPHAFGGSGADALRRSARALAWERLGGRAVLVTLTYPNDWRRWAPDGTAVSAHRRAFFRAWEREWGTGPFGLWVLEFQQRGAPHLHLYVRIPDAVGDEDVELVRQHTVKAKAGGRGPNGERLGWRPVTGKFGWWARHAWVDAVGTRGSTDEARHHAGGVDMQMFYWSEAAWERVDGLKVSEYLARETGKEIQKKAPEGFGRVHMWRAFGGFEPVVLVDEPVDDAVAVELNGLMEAKLRSAYGELSRVGRRWRGGAGKCVYQEFYESIAMLEEAERGAVGERAGHVRSLARLAQAQARWDEARGEGA